MYRVTAVNSHGDSQWSKYASATTLAAPQPQPDPEDTDPDDSIPETDPDDTDPDDTDPDETDPDDTEPDETDPDDTEPDEAAALRDSEPSGLGRALVSEIEVVRPEPRVALPHRTDNEYSGFEPIANPRDLWTDGTTIWIVDTPDHALRAYDLKTGDRKSDDDLEPTKPTGVAENHTLRAVWASEDWIFLGHSPSSQVRMYHRDSTGLTTTRQAGFARRPWALWSNGERMFVGGADGFSVADFGFVNGNPAFGAVKHVGTDSTVRGISGDEETLWTLERDPDGYIIRARDLQTFARQPEKDFFPVDQEGVAFAGLLVHDDHMWIVQIETEPYVHVFHYRHNSSGAGQIRVVGEPLLGEVLTPDMGGITAMEDPNGLDWLFKGDFEFSVGAD